MTSLIAVGASCYIAGLATLPLCVGVAYLILARKIL